MKRLKWVSPSLWMTSWLQAIDDDVTMLLKTVGIWKKKFTYGPIKIKYMTVKTGHENDQEITEEVEAAK